MPNIKLIVEYNGAAFHGWQQQPGMRTIQEELGKVIGLVLRSAPPVLIASGRTDAGVHARAQVVNFWCEEAPDLKRLIRSISNILKSELSILSAEIVADDFNARAWAKRKQYSYVILNRPAPAVLDHGRVWHIAIPLNIERMKEQAKILEGEHDFTSFRGSGCGAKSAVRKIYESEITCDRSYITYRVVGSGFLKQMVRNIVGTLVGIGRARSETLSVQEILNARNRRVAGITAPAYGLCLDWVEY